MSSSLDTVVIVGGPLNGLTSQVLTTEALGFLASLHRQFDCRRKELLNDRLRMQEQLDKGTIPVPSGEFAGIRSDPSWKVAPVPVDLQKRWVEITGPVERKQILGALNCGADVFMADFEDASAPSWTVMINGQINVRDACNKTISVTNTDGSVRKLKDQHAALLVRPRGFHLDENNLWVDGVPMSASFFDAGLYMFHNGRTLVSQGKGPRFYIPKLESGREAKLWADFFCFAEDRLGLPSGCSRATVLIETIFGALQMEEMAYALRNYLAGFNAGRWDYIFSVIKRFRSFRNAVMPDRAKVTMTVPFMAAYCERLVAVCHSRGAHAIGGMAANVPSRTDKEANARALALVEADKKRELSLGFDGTWVAHPDLVKPVRELFQAKLGSNPHQKDVNACLRKKSLLDETKLVDFSLPLDVTSEGVRANIHAAIQYIACWLSGAGAVALEGKMEDAATAEISRAQLWQWLKFQVPIDGSVPFTRAEYIKRRHHEALSLAPDHPSKPSWRGQEYLKPAIALLDRLVLSQNDFKEFLTNEAYEMLLRFSVSPLALTDANMHESSAAKL